MLPIATIYENIRLIASPAIAALSPVFTILDYISIGTLAFLLGFGAWLDNIEFQHVGYGIGIFIFLLCRSIYWLVKSRNEWRRGNRKEEQTEDKS